MAQFNKLGIEDVKKSDYENSRVVVRVDFNVPIVDGRIYDDFRIKSTLPTLKYILDQKVKCLIIISHLGRPSGKKDPSLSLKIVSEHLEKLMDRKVQFIGDCVGEEVDEKISKAKQGDIFFLENVRFYKQEEAKVVDESVKKFREQLSKNCDIFVNDAFACCHRAHSSMVGIMGTKKLCVAGYLLKKEIDYFGKVLTKPEKPFLAILGGKKVSTKIGVIDNLLTIVDEMLICGGMNFTFKKVVDGMKIGDSIYDKKGAEKVKGYVEKAKELGVNMSFPIDWVVTDDFVKNTHIKTVDEKEGIPDGWEGCDCGEASNKKFKEVIEKCKTIIWNGPAGVFENKNFAKGTETIAKAMVEATKNGATTIVAGGDSAAAIAKMNLMDQVSHVSTGGGASLELCEGKKLPGMVYLTEK